MALYCDVYLPVPLDQPFTYALSGEMQQTARVGCRVLVPFQQRKLSGTILRLHDDTPGHNVRPVEKLLDAEPIFDEKLIALGLWVARYYFAPVGEVFRGMAPLGGEVKHSKKYVLTDAGRDVARQSMLGIVAAEDPALIVLRALEEKPSAIEALKRKTPDAARLVAEFQRKGLVKLEEEARERDPLRAPASKLNVEGLGKEPEGKLAKWERELLAFLHLHPGAHPLDETEEIVKNASQSARSLARCGLVKLTPRMSAIRVAPERPCHPLNASQQTAYDRLAAAVQAGKYAAFLLQGVTGSGKTEV